MFDVKNILKPKVQYQKGKKLSVI